MSRLSIKALRLYDEQGLLSPVHVDETTGYRYYHLAQLRHAEIIRILRMTDMPLQDIHVILKSASEAEIIAQLQAHKARLTRRLAEQQQMLDYLNTIIERKELVMTYEIELEAREPQLIAAVRFRTNAAEIGNDIAAGFHKLVSGMGEAGRSPAGMPMILYHDVIDAENDGDVEIAVPISGPIAGPVSDTFSGAGEVFARRLEGGTVVATEHRGSYAAIAPAYHSLTKWITEHDYQIVDAPREIYLNDPQLVAEADLLTRVEFPVAVS